MRRIIKFILFAHIKIIQNIKTLHKISIIILNITKINLILNNIFIYFLRLIFKPVLIFKFRHICLHKFLK